MNLINSQSHSEDKSTSKTSGLRISELFYNTIQGEGVNTGVPAVFLRLQGCTLNCQYCDTKEIYVKGTYYHHTTLINLLKESEVVDLLKNGHHLILTGGSPLLQQDSLVVFLRMFIDHFNFKPYIEVENEVQIMPKENFIQYVDCWNNSPKLLNSLQQIPINATIFKRMRSLKNCWFKFVVHNSRDWDEIYEEYIKPKHVRRCQVILMPMAATKIQLIEVQKDIVKLAVENNVRYSDRLHIHLWDTQISV